MNRFTLSHPAVDHLFLETLVIAIENLLFPTCFPLLFFVTVLAQEAQTSQWTLPLFQGMQPANGTWFSIVCSPPRVPLSFPITPFRRLIARFHSRRVPLGTFFLGVRWPFVFPHTPTPFPPRVLTQFCYRYTPWDFFHKYFPVFVCNLPPRFTK